MLLYKYKQIKDVREMIIGVPTEIKNNESRVSAIPGVVGELVHDGHIVYV